MLPDRAEVPVGGEAFEPELRTDGWHDPAPDREWVIKDLLPAYRVTLLSGPGGSGKSRLALQLAAAVAAPLSRWVASPAVPDPVPELEPEYSGVDHAVIYASYEDERDEMARRLQACEAADKRDKARLTGGVGWHNLGGGATLTEHLDAHRTLGYYPAAAPLWEYSAATGRGGWTNPGKDLKQIMEEQRQTRAGLLIIDSAAAAWSGNENARSEVRGFLMALDQWAQSSRITVLLLAHPPKVPGISYSGSTDWVNACRMVWILESAETTIDIEALDGKGKAERPDGMQLRVEKSNYGPVRSWWLQQVSGGVWRGATEQEAAASRWLARGDERPLPEKLGGRARKS